MNDAGADPDQPEILGRLPRTRPGRRSPRRDEAARARERRAERVAAGSRTEPDEPDATRARPRLDTHAPGAADALAGVARTGVAVATGAVGLGLRAAGGALRVVRGTVDRR